MIGELVIDCGYRLSGYVDREHDKLGLIVEPLGVAVSHLEEELVSHIRDFGRYPDDIDACALGVGDNRARQRCLEGLEGLDLPCLVHPSASVSRTAYLGRGSVVCAQAVVNTGAWIGDGVIVNSGAIIEHDCVVGTAVHVSPGAVLCGEVHVAARSWIGAGSTIIQGIMIGEDAIVGAGSTVIRNVNQKEIVMGSPARMGTARKAEEGGS